MPRIPPGIRVPTTANLTPPATPYVTLPPPYTLNQLRNRLGTESTVLRRTVGYTEATESRVEDTRRDRVDIRLTQEENCRAIINAFAAPGPIPPNFFPRRFRHSISFCLYLALHALGKGSHYRKASIGVKVEPLRVRVGNQSFIYERDVRADKFIGVLQGYSFR